MSNKTQVLIAGGGPVGLSLSLELASHGIKSILLERNATTTRHPKMDLTNGRSMELFRRMGVAEDLRAVGVPGDHHLDIIWATSATGTVLHRFPYPTPDGRRDQTRVANDGRGTWEPSLRVSQVEVEPVLKQKAEESEFIDVRFGWAYESHEETADGVLVTIRNTETDATEQLSGDYLAGCDGGGSKVRQAMGIELDGQFKVAEAYTAHFRSTDYDVLAKFGITYHLQTAVGSMISQNGKDIWTIHGFTEPQQPKEWIREFVGQDFEFELLLSNPWTPHLVVAKEYRKKRVFLAGDSAHQLIPTGGFGMNTGIGDAVDLGWKLSAVLNGWGGEALLDSYEIERLPVAQRNVAMSFENTKVRMAIAEAYAKAMEEGDLEADDAEARRLALGSKIKALGNQENERWGVEHGYYYEGSPVIISDGSDLPEFNPDVCQPTTCPGARLPHIYLYDGCALYEYLGREFSLIVIGEVDSSAFEIAAAKAQLPLTVIRLANEPILDLLERKLILVRPDQHVAWRGDTLPDNCEKVIEQVTGRV
ncbi:FAD-monooxygenase [Pseudomaricurvus alcaniphilus]|uniref:FAD-dependent monooxygenase n=1 Tax=Pseudomaricurvus alcaniphilus TaxID=1166482 RepID=UPI00140E8542|nr:FAD-dependent monooxygenase [Pseudomaricurvus alcaniphilus]NHN36518.1 FAD-monooxygenase [Pseudomaricurvus alcaniphilus]